MLDDDWFDELDPFLRRLMYEHWCCDEEENYEILKSQSILIGSFANPDAAKAMLKADNPDFASTDEDFEKSLAMVEADRQKQFPPKKRRRRLKKENS